MGSIFPGGGGGDLRLPSFLVEVKCELAWSFNPDRSGTKFNPSLYKQDWGIAE